MNWTELGSYVPLADIRKFIKYASDNKISSTEPCDVGSYFSDMSKSRERVLGDIMEYDFFDIEKIEQLFDKTLTCSRLTNVDILLRITAAALLKNKPKETGIRESFSTDDGKKGEIEFKGSKSEPERTPPQFYYPM